MVSRDQKTAAKASGVDVRFAAETSRRGGEIDLSAVDRELRIRTSSFKKCHERELVRDPTAGGEVVAKFVIGTAGHVTSSKAAGGSMGKDARECVADEVTRIRFPRPSRGQVHLEKRKRCEHP